MDHHLSRQDDRRAEGASARPPVVRTEVRSDGVAVLTIDDPRSTHNTLRPASVRDLFAALASVEADARVLAVVVRSGKSSFVAGADLGFVRSIKYGVDAEAASSELARRFADLERLRKPVVACVHGAALGVGLELSLACAASIATDHASTRLGFPEIELGLLPAANGLLRVAERAGARVALDLGLTGRRLRPEEALRLGLVDDVVDEPIALETAGALASRLAREPNAARALAKARTRTARRPVARWLSERNALGRAVLFRRVRRQVQELTGGHREAAERIVELLERWATRGRRAAADLEPRLFGDLVTTDAARRLVEIALAQEALDEDRGLEPSEAGEPLPVERIGVVGAGLAGAEIAAVSVRAGLPVRMKDTDDLAVGRGLRYVNDVLAEQARHGELAPWQRDRARSLLGAGTDYAGFRRADLVIEAVFEDLALKQTVVRELEAIVSDRCVIASNASAIPITRVADAATRPERVVGMRYVSRRLLEVVRAKATDPAVVATAVALGKRQGKTVIVVRDGPAFYTTRILVSYLNEAVHLLSEGYPIDAIDRAIVALGFPVGPFHLLDEIGIERVTRVGRVTEEAFGERMRTPDALRTLREDHREGRKNERGFYLYARGAGSRRAATVDATVYDVLEIAPRSHSPRGEVEERCELAMVNEAVRAYGDRIVRSARDGDTGAILGAGYPASRGGPFRWIDTSGAASVLRRLRSLEQRFGARFEPAPLLVEMARTGKRFYG